MCFHDTSRAVQPDCGGAIDRCLQLIDFRIRLPRPDKICPAMLFLPGRTSVTGIRSAGRTPSARSHRAR